MSIMSEADIIRQNRDYEDSIINGDALDEPEVIQDNLPEPSAEDIQSNLPE